MIARHPKTTFINTHFGNNAEDLASVADKLDKYPNMYVDIDARISELGRQPYTARKFFLKYQDRIMFGTDTHAAARRLPHLLPLPGDGRRVLRLLRQPPPAGVLEHLRHLPAADEVLEKVYRKNAERILFGLKTDEERQAARRTELQVRPTDDFEVTGDGSAEGVEEGRMGAAAQARRRRACPTRRR